MRRQAMQQSLDELRVKVQHHKQPGAADDSADGKADRL
jgi:hypothetical protein